MGKGKDKKSAPRGKKAREVKKLERRWGEAVNEDEVKNARIRKGVRRLTDAESKARILSKTLRFSSHVNTTKEEDHTSTDFMNPSSSYKRRKIGESADDLDDDSEHEEKQHLGGHGTNASSLQSLLKSIHNKSRNHGKNSSTSLNEMVDEEGFEVVSEETEDEDESTNPDVDDSSGSQRETEDEDEDELTTELLNNISSEFKEEESDDDVLSTEYLKKNHHNPFFQHFFPLDTELSSLELSNQTSVQSFQSLATKQLNPSLQLQVSQQVLQQHGNDLEEVIERSSPSSSSGEPPHLSLEKCQQISCKHLQYCQHRLVQEWRNFNATVVRQNVDALDHHLTKKSPLHNFSTLQSVLYPFMTQYVDLFLTCETRQNTDSIRNLVLLHSLNHILTSNRFISRNNKYLKQQSGKEDEVAPKKKKVSATMEKEDESSKVRDQGYTRPKVLILLPTRGTCLVFVQKLLQLLDKGTKVDQLERFEAEYSAPISPQENEPNHTDPEKERRRKSILKEKGPDWLELFGDEVNSDDDFKIGLSFQHVNGRVKEKEKDKQGPRRNVHVKLYSEFYHSDMIIASPLALKIHSDSEDEDNVDHDFLSSIEVCIVCHCDTLLMQNWDHLNSVLDIINQQPKKIKGIDFSRVRNYFLSGLASKFRQLIVVSRFMDANILSTFKKYATSSRGQVKLRRKCNEEEASICSVSIRIPQVFQRVMSESFLSQGDDRLKYFTNKVLPHILRLQQKHTMIYIPSYFDFTAVRNLLLKKEASFVSVTEYSRTSEISRGRARFLQGRKSIMLYTGRSFFFMRHLIKGVRHLVLFGLPEHAEFYPNLINMLSNAFTTANGDDADVTSNEPLSSLCLFTKYDAHALERIVGTKHCELMIKGEKTTFLFNS